jgi:hypothetical protein
MYNIDLYTYWKKPFFHGKNFTIHPLDEPGKEKIYSDQSHYVHYLKRTDPFVFKSIMGCDYETLVKNQLADIDTLKRLKERGFNTQASLNPDSSSPNQNNEISYGRHVNKYVTEVEEEKNNKKFKNLENLENSTFYNTKVDNRIRSTRNKIKNGNGYQPYQNYTSSGDNFLFNFRNEQRNRTRSLSKRKFNGLKGDFRPNTAGISYAEKKFNPKIQTINSYELRYPIPDETLKESMFNSTSTNFKTRYRLPDVCKPQKPNMILTQQKIGLSKEMGEKYNPFALYPPSKNRTGRNYVGDLFKH